MSTGLRCFPEQSCYVRSQLDLEIVSFPLCPVGSVEIAGGLPAKMPAWMLRGFYSVDDVAKAIPDPLMFSLTNHGIILISKFLEVWDDFSGLASQDARVVPARKAVDPFIARILVWKGLVAFRHSALAHAYETKDGRPVGPWYLLATHAAPTYHAEVILLLHLVNLSTAAILAAFYKEYRDLGPVLKPDLPNPDAGPGISTGDQIAAVQRQLTAEVDARLRAIGVQANPVFAEFRDATHPTRARDGR